MPLLELAPLAQPVPLATNGLSSLVLIAVVVVGFILLVQRPMRRQQEAQRKLQESVHEGSRVMLTSGIFGTVTHLGDKQAIVELAPGLEVTVVRQAISKAVTPDEEEFEFDDATAGAAGVGDRDDLDEWALDRTDDADTTGTTAPATATSVPDHVVGDPDTATPAGLAGDDEAAGTGGSHTVTPQDAQTAAWPPHEDAGTTDPERR